eukprot:2969937-Prymnesium_polylepis.2
MHEGAEEDSGDGVVLMAESPAVTGAPSRDTRTTWKMQPRRAAAHTTARMLSRRRTPIRIAGSSRQWSKGTRSMY